MIELKRFRRFSLRGRQTELSLSEWADAWRRDIVFGARVLRRDWRFTGIVVVTLALGFGANASIFSFLDQVFFRPPAGLSRPETLRRIWLSHPGYVPGTYEVRNSLSHHEYRAVAHEIGDMAQLALYSTRPEMPIGRGDRPSTATIAYATASYFNVLGVRPILGRPFSEAEADIHGAKAVVVVSYAFWRARLGADPNILGRPLTVADRDYTIIGVTPPAFAGIDLQATDLWLPLGMYPTRETARVPFWDSSVIVFTPIARVRAGVSDHAIDDRATTAYRQQPVTDFPPSREARLLFRSIIDARGPGPKPQELSVAVRLGGVAVIILLIAAMNVSNLLLTRAMTRRREAAVRLALGIERGRLMRLYVIESALLSLLAVAATLVVAEYFGGFLRTILLPETHFATRVLRWQLALSTVLLSLGIGVLVGLVPALSTGKTDLTLSLKGGIHARDGRRSRVPAVLVAVQAALSVVLLVGAACLVTSLRNVQQRRIGFDAARVLYASIVLPLGWQPDTSRFSASMRAAGDRVRTLPGVEVVAFAREEPMSTFGWVRFYTATDSSEAPGRPMPTASYVSSDFFKAVGMNVLRGTSFSDRAGLSSTEVMVNEALAAEYWPGGTAIGQCVRIMARNSPCLTVAGVVEDAIREKLLEKPAPQLYLPIFTSIRGQRPPTVMVVHAEPERIPLVARQVSRVLQQEFGGGDPRVVRMIDRLAPQYRPWRLGATLFALLGLLALSVAALGVYSSVSYMVTQRTHELGVRIALGARIGDVARYVMRRALVPVAVGGALGVALAIAGARLTTSLLYGVAVWNPVLLGSVFVSLIVVAAFASWIPARRAVRIDPTRAMIKN